jgi:hypothetical protein
MSLQCWSKRWSDKASPASSERGLMGLKLVKPAALAIRTSSLLGNYHVVRTTQGRGLFGNLRMTSNHINTTPTQERISLHKPFLLDPIPGAELYADGTSHRETRDWVSELELEEVSRLTQLASSQGQAPRILILYGSLRER